jgi:signal transduction histidine kinase
MFRDESSVRIGVSCSVITSSINGARHPQSLVETLAAGVVGEVLDFDYCGLVLPEPDGRGLRVWRASRSQQTSTIDEPFNQAGALLARILGEGSVRLIGEGEMRQSPGEFGTRVKSALALPLSVGGSCFGLLCFACEGPDAFAKEEAERLAWLADVVAAASEVILLRSRLDAANDSLREMERLKSGFVNTLVRDIRLPLTSVLGLLELFESKLQAREPFDMEDRQLLNNAIENGDRMRHLLDDHLEIARQHEQPLSLALEEINAEGLLEEAVEPLRGEAALRGVELNVTVAGKELLMRVDARQTRRALCHLLTTALAATNDGGVVSIEAQTINGTRAGDEGNRFVIISISDSSQGIPPEELPFVFDAFWQASDNRSSGFKGIGLAIAKRIAAAHGGNVSVRSQRGRGTVYSLVLPASPQKSAAEMRRVLIVDDVPELLMLLRKLVARMGYQVETASNAAAALSVMEEKQVDLVLTDWSMPEMSGGELIAAMKASERLRETPVIVLTGHDTDSERQAAEAAGCDRFLVKPVMRDVLQRVINELMPALAAR